MPVKVEQINEYLFSDTVQSQKIKSGKTKSGITKAVTRLAIIFALRMHQPSFLATKATHTGYLAQASS